MYNNMYGNMQAQSYVQQQVPNYTQPLSAEDIQALMKGTKSSWTMTLTPEEKMRAICTHKDVTKGNQMSLNPAPGGFGHVCYICGETVLMKEFSKDEVIDLVESVVNVLQNVKTMYLDMPVGVAADYMLLIPLLRKLPDLYEISKNNFAKYDNVLHNNIYGTGNTFAALNNLLSPGYGGMPGMMPGMMPQGMPGMMPQYPQMQQQMPGQQPYVDPSQMQYQQQMQQMQNQGQNPFYNNGQMPPIQMNCVPAPGQPVAPQQQPQQGQQQATPATPYTPAPTGTPEATTTSKMFKA